MSSLPKIVSGRLLFDEPFIRSTFLIPDGMLIPRKRTEVFDVQTINSAYWRGLLTVEILVYI